MGYTRYWERTAKEFDEEFIEFCNEVFKTCNKLGVPYIYALPIILREALTRGYITDLSDDGIMKRLFQMMNIK